MFSTSSASCSAVFASSCVQKHNERQNIFIFKAVVSTNQAELVNLTQKQAELKSEPASPLELHEGEQKTIRAYKGFIGRLQAKIEALEGQIADQNKAKEAPEHSFTPYLPFCTGGCGAKNLNYKKPEVRCSGKDCPMHTIGLGSLEEAKKLEACPGCGRTGNILQRMESKEREEGENDKEEESEDE